MPNPDLLSPSSQDTCVLTPNPHRYANWPNDALEAVALKFLRDVDVAEEQRQQIMVMCKVSSCLISLGESLLTCDGACFLQGRRCSRP